jgi:hypothetical protein
LPIILHSFSQFSRLIFKFFQRQEIGSKSNFSEPPYGNRRARKLFQQSYGFEAKKETIDPDVASSIRRIDQALRSFFKPQYGSPPSARIVLDAMMGLSQGFQVVHRYSGLFLYCMRQPAGDPLRRYMTLFRSEKFEKMFYIVL